MAEPQGRELEIYLFIKGRIEHTGLAPTFPEIAEHFGIHIRKVAPYVQSLVARGKLIRLTKKHRRSVALPISTRGDHGK